MVEGIKAVLIRRDELTEADADELIADAKEDFEELIANGELDAAENICEDWFGLESDYLEEFI